MANPVVCFLKKDNKKIKTVFVLTTNKEPVSQLVQPIVESESAQLNIGTDLPKVASPEQDDLLVLIDCEQINWPTAIKLLEDAQTALPRATAGLLFVPANADVSEALRWPILTGIFDASFDTALIAKGLKEMIEGRYWFSRKQMNMLAKLRRVPAKPIANPTESLSRRELEVLALTSQGKSNADIAEELYLSQHTVKTHLYNLYRKLGVVNRTQAVHWYQTTMMR
jgi:LuxR family transcriptional regulator of csgAB operon